MPFTHVLLFFALFFVQEPFPAKHRSTQRIDTHSALAWVRETSRVDRLDGPVCVVCLEGNAAVQGGAPWRGRVVRLADFTLAWTA